MTQLFYFVLLIVSAAQGEKLLTTDLDDEETYEDLTATIKFWMCKIDEWPNKLESFQKIIASLANAYCEPQPTVCCISRWGNHSIFSPLGVRILPNFPMMERFTFIHVKFIILYKAEMHMSRNLFDLSLDHCQKLFAKTPYALVSEVLEDIIEVGLRNISNAVGWPIVPQHQISSIERFVNIALVPIGIVFCLALLISVRGVKQWRERKDEKSYRDRHTRKMLSRKKRKELCRRFDSLNPSISSPRKRLEPHETITGSLALPLLKPHHSPTITETSGHTVINVEAKEPLTISKML